MRFISLLMIALAVSIDGFWGGFAFGLKKTRIPLISLIIISSWSIVCTMAAMIFGSSIKNYIPIEWVKYIGASLLLLLGIFTLKEGFEHKKKKNIHPMNKPKNAFDITKLFLVLHNPIAADVDEQNDIKPSESTLLGIAVAMDASIAAFTLSLLGFNPYTTPFLFGATHFLLIGAGNLLAKLRIINYFSEKFSLIPGIILIGLALLRFV